MKIMKRMKSNKYLQTAFWKRNFKFAVFHLLNALFVLLLFFFLHKLEGSRLITEARNEALPGETTEYFTIDGPGQMDFSFLFVSEEFRNITLLAHRPSTGLQYLVLYTSGEKDIFGGNYFEKKDFKNGVFSMVLGCNLREDGEEAEALREMAAYQEKEAVLRGRLPESVNAAWNYSIFYTPGSLGEMEIPPVLAISSAEKSCLETALSALSKEISERGGTLRLCDFRQVEYQDFLGQNKIDVMLFYGLLLILFLSEWAAAYVVSLWRRPLRRVQFFLGKRKIIWKESVRSFFLLAVDVICGGLLICLIFHGIVPVKPDILLFSVLTVLASGTLAICIVARKRD